MTDIHAREARSSTFLTQADRLAFAFAAAREYRSSRSLDARTVSQRSSGFSMGGLPLPRFGAVMGGNCTNKKSLDAIPLWVFNVPTVNQEGKMEMTTEKPRTRKQGTTIIERHGDEWFVMFPNGAVKVLTSKEAAEKSAKRWFKDNADDDAVNVGLIEWR